MNRIERQKLKALLVILACFIALAWYLMTDPGGQASGERLNAALSHLAGTSTAPEGNTEASDSDADVVGSSGDSAEPPTPTPLFR